MMFKEEKGKSSQLFSLQQILAHTGRVHLAGGTAGSSPCTPQHGAQLSHPIGNRDAPAPTEAGPAWALDPVLLSPLLCRKRPWEGQ